MSYFNRFPTTVFLGEEVTDITRKAQLSKISKDSALSYMSYTVKEGERPEDIAYYYYDSVNYAWLVLASNDIVDPYTQWPKGLNAFERYIMTEYEKASGTTGQGVIEWSQNATLGANIVHYESISNPNIKLNRASYLASDENEKAEYAPVRVYDYEFQLNESRREIVLVNKSYLEDIDSQLKEELNAK